MEISAFKNILRTENIDTIIRKYIMHGEPYIIPDNKYFDLKYCIANNFHIHPTSIFMVGSGKLGFSIKPKRRYQFFGEKSDIDMAIISLELFETVWKEVYSFWIENGWWSKEEDFKKYLFRGWIRPDLLPSGESFSFSRNWWNFFRNISSSNVYGPYSIKAGIYHSLFFFEQYQSICIKQCKVELEY
jgi:hypothetical protein